MTKITVAYGNTAYDKQQHLTLPVGPILNKLGPAVCQRVMPAFDHPQHSFNGCFLAMLYGERGELNRDHDAWVADKASKFQPRDILHYVARKVGLTVWEARAIVHNYDMHFAAFNEIFRTFVAKWDLKAIAQEAEDYGVTCRFLNSLTDADLYAGNEEIEPVDVKTVTSEARERDLEYALSPMTREDTNH